MEKIRTFIPLPLLPCHNHPLPYEWLTTGNHATETPLSEIVSVKYTVFLRVINIQRKKNHCIIKNKSDFSAALSALLVTPPGAFRHWRSCSVASRLQLLECALVKRIESLPLLFLFYIFPLPFYLLPFTILAIQPRLLLFLREPSGITDSLKQKIHEVTTNDHAG